MHSLPQAGFLCFLTSRPPTLVFRKMPALQSRCSWHLGYNLSYTSAWKMQKAVSLCLPHIDLGPLVYFTAVVLAFSMSELIDTQP